MSERAPQNERQPDNQIRRPREGFKDFKTRLDTLVYVGGNTFGRKRKPLLEETR